MKNKFDGLDYLIGTCAWVIFLIFALTSSDCLKTNSCGGFDMLLFGVIAVGMLVPSWVAMMLFSDIFRKKD